MVKRILIAVLLFCSFKYSIGQTLNPIPGYGDIQERIVPTQVLGVPSGLGTSRLPTGVWYPQIRWNPTDASLYVINPGNTWKKVGDVSSANIDSQLNLKQNKLPIGTISQYFRGDLTLSTFSTDVFAAGDPRYSLQSHLHQAGQITDFVTSVRGLFSSGTSILYDAATGKISYTGTPSTGGTVTGVSGNYPLSVANQFSTPIITLDTLAGRWRSENYLQTIFVKNQRLLDTATAIRASFPGIATTTTLGLVKIGSGLNIDAAGMLATSSSLLTAGTVPYVSSTGLFTSNGTFTYNGSNSLNIGTGGFNGSGSLSLNGGNGIVSAGGGGFTIYTQGGTPYDLSKRIRFYNGAPSTGGLQWLHMYLHMPGGVTNYTDPLNRARMESFSDLHPNGSKVYEFGLETNMWKTVRSGRVYADSLYIKDAYIDFNNLGTGGGGTTDISGLLVKSQNLFDLTNVVTARTNLGLGTLATQSGTFSGTFSGTSSGTNTGDQSLAGLLVKASNLFDLTNIATARTNLGLTSVATQTVPAGILKGVTGVLTASVPGTDYMTPAGTSTMIDDKLTAGESIITNTATGFKIMQFTAPNKYNFKTLLAGTNITLDETTTPGSIIINSAGGTSGTFTLNTLTATTQTFAVGTTGTDFNISSATSVHTFNIPDASSTNRGFVNISAQSFIGQKTFSGGVGTSTSNISANFFASGGSGGLSSQAGIISTRYLTAKMGTAVGFRNAFGGSTNYTIVVGESYFSSIQGQSIETENTTGNHPIIGGFAALAPGLTAGTATVGIGTAIYGGPAPTYVATEGNFSGYFDGLVRVEGIRDVSTAGVGTRMVVADANGNYSTQAIPSGGSGTVDQTIIDASANAVAGNAVFDALALKQNLNTQIDNAQASMNEVITWAGITGFIAPVGPFTNSYQWSQTGKRVTLRINIIATTSGTAVTTATFNMPADLPAPALPTGFTTGDVMYYGDGFINSVKSISPERGRSAIVYQGVGIVPIIDVKITPSLAAKFVWVTIQYFVP